jgi:ketosteroid isomerase-like protein
MQRINGFAAVLMLFLASGAAFSQDSGNDAAAVWAAVEEVWSAEENGDTGWTETMLTGDFMGWPTNSPAPRSKASTRMWSRFNADQTKGLTHELYPLSIVVHGDTAVVHYLYSMAVQTKDKQTSLTNGRFTDILVREDGSWKFLSWHGGSTD